MQKPIEKYVTGLPTEDQYQGDAALCRSRLIRDVDSFLERAGAMPLNIQIVTSDYVEPKGEVVEKQTDRDELSTEQRAEQYVASIPLHSLEQLIVPADMMAQINLTIHSIRVEPLVYDTWGLRKIESFPRSALNFHGAPGTGKTLAAHSIASALGKKILVASYAQIESKFHGDGPKNVEALFFAAQRDEAVLFIDEADSLLSRRLTNVTQGSEQAINSMRSQLLICLEKFRGVVIFATNLVENYDDAFETRVRHIKFPMPNAQARFAIWQKHLPFEMPLEGVEIAELVELGSDFCGRDIKNAVINAATQAAIESKTAVAQSDFLFAIQKIKDARSDLRPALLNFATAQEASTELSSKIADAVKSVE